MTTRRSFGLSLAVGAVMLAGLGFAANQRTTSAWAHVRAARDLATAGSAQSAVAVCTELEAAHADVAPLMPLVALAGQLPIERARAWGQAPLLLQASQAGCQGLSAATRLLTAVDTSATPSSGAALLRALQDDGAATQQVGEAITASLDALDQVDLHRLGAEERFVALVPPIEAIRAHALELRALAALAPRAGDLSNRLLGGDGPRTYLLVGQNEDEARASGGFIGTLGTLTVSEGRVVASDIRSSYLWDRAEVAKLPAPGPLEKYMNFGGWYLRDANWWVDFPRTANQLLLMWDREQGNAGGIDGVIAIDRAALEGLLAAVGGADVPELGGYVTAGTAKSALDSRRRSSEALRSYESYQRVKTEALSGLYKGLMAKLTKAHGAELAMVVVALGEAAEQKHLLLWFRDAELQALAADQDWDGRLDAGVGDFTGVVNTSISYGKVMPFIDRTASYRRLPDGSAVLELQYRNRFEPEPGAAWDPLIDGTWWDWRAQVFRRQQGAWLGYVRALAPTGSQLLGSDGWDDAPSTTAEGAVTVFGAPLLVRPGETRTARLTYADPMPVAAALTVFRQPGTP